MAKNDWVMIVRRYYGQSDNAEIFIKAVERHIATYDAMSAATERFQDPKKTFEELKKIQEMAKELGMMLVKADRQTISYIEQGALIVPNNDMESLDWCDVERLPHQLLGMAKAIDLVVEEMADDEDIKRVGYHKLTPRHVFVRAVCDSFEECFAPEKPEADNNNFARILDSLFPPLGIPRSKLSRTIEDSIPPQ